MIGALFMSRQQRIAAEAYQQLCREAISNQIEATERAKVARYYMWDLNPPPIEKRGGVWFAIIESGPSVPKVAKP